MARFIDPFGDEYEQDEVPQTSVVSMQDPFGDVYEEEVLQPNVATTNLYTDEEAYQYGIKSDSIIQDVASGFVTGSNALLEGVGTLYGLATGDMKNWAIEQGKRGQEFGADIASDRLKEQKQQRSEAIKQADGVLDQAGVALWKTFQNPRLLSNLLVTTAPTLLAGGFVGRGIGVAAKALKGSESVVKYSAISGTMGSMSAIQGASVSGETYSQLLQQPIEVWNAHPKFNELKQRVGEDAAKDEIALEQSRKVFALATGLSLASQALPGASAFDKALAGQGSKIAGNFVARTAKTALPEGTQEVIEEAGGKLLSNAAVKEINPNQVLTEGVGEAAGLAFAASAVMGGGNGALSKPLRIESEVKSVEENANAVSELLDKKQAEAPIVNEPIQADIQQGQSSLQQGQSNLQQRQDFDPETGEIFNSALRDAQNYGMDEQSANEYANTAVNNAQMEQAQDIANNRETDGIGLEVEEYGDINDLTDSRIFELGETLETLEAGKFNQVYYTAIFNGTPTTDIINKLEGLINERTQFSTEQTTQLGQNNGPLQQPQSTGPKAEVSQPQQTVAREQTQPVDLPPLEPSVYEADEIAPKAKQGDLNYNLPKNTIVGGVNEIAQLVPIAKANKTEKSAVRFNIVDEQQALKLKEKTGFELSGYKHTVDSSGINHAFKKHGDTKAEALRGQIAVTDDDFALIPDIVENYDDVKYVGKDKKGQDIIRYQKAYNGTTYFTEEIRNKRKELVLKSLWKTHTREQMPDQKEHPSSNVQNRLDSNSPQVNKSIDPKPNAFKPAHELSDGTPVIAVADEQNVWQDQQGEEIEDGSATALISKSSPQLDIKKSILPVDSVKNKATPLPTPAVTLAKTDNKELNKSDGQVNSDGVLLDDVPDFKPTHVLPNNEALMVYGDNNELVVDEWGEPRSQDTLKRAKKIALNDKLNEGKESNEKQSETEETLAETKAAEEKPVKKVKQKPHAKKAKQPKMIDRLANYFREGRIVSGYMGSDKVIKFHLSDSLIGGWEVEVVQVDDSENEIGHRRVHSTQPSEKNLSSWEKDNPIQKIGENSNERQTETNDAKAKESNTNTKPIKTSENERASKADAKPASIDIRQRLEASKRTGSEGVSMGENAGHGKIHLDDITIKMDAGDVVMSDSAANWLSRIDERLEQINELRGCMR